MEWQPSWIRATQTLVMRNIITQRSKLSEDTEVVKHRGKGKLMARCRALVRAKNSAPRNNSASAAQSAWKTAPANKAGTQEIPAKFPPAQRKAKTPAKPPRVCLLWKYWKSKKNGEFTQKLNCSASRLRTAWEQAGGLPRRCAYLPRLGQTCVTVTPSRNASGRAGLNTAAEHPVSTLRQTKQMTQSQLWGSKNDIFENGHTGKMKVCCEPQSRIKANFTHGI